MQLDIWVGNVAEGWFYSFHMASKRAKKMKRLNVSKIWDRFILYFSKKFRQQNAPWQVNLSVWTYFVRLRCTKDLIVSMDKYYQWSIARFLVKQKMLLFIVSNKSLFIFSRMRLIDPSRKKRLDHWPMLTLFVWFPNIKPCHRRYQKGGLFASLEQNNCQKHSLMPKWKRSLFLYNCEELKKYPFSIK